MPSRHRTYEPSTTEAKAVDCDEWAVTSFSQFPLGQVQSQTGFVHLMSRLRSSTGLVAELLSAVAGQTLCDGNGARRTEREIRYTPRTNQSCPFVPATLWKKDAGAVSLSRRHTPTGVEAHHEAHITVLHVTVVRHTRI